MNNRVMKKVVIDPYRGGEDIGSSANGIIEKDFNLEIGKYIYDRLRSLGVPVAITRDTDETIDMRNRINKIKSFYGTGNDVIVISNALTKEGDGAEIVYALRNSNALSQKIANEIEKTGMEVGKFYQRRLPSNTALDYNQLIRDTASNESLIIYYGNVDNTLDSNLLKNKLEDLGEAVVIALADYLNIEYKPVSGSNYYIVKKGDSLYGIASKYGTTVNAIKVLNNLSSNLLQIGQTLKIPSSNKEESTSYITYQVVGGDSLYSIAKKYGTTVDAIKSLNNLSSNLLQIGQTLKIPTTSSSVEPIYLTYQVVSGDNLYSIAKKYNTTVSAIKTLNNLVTDILSIGQVLKIPTTSGTSTSSNYLTYKVVSGDSLYSIAKKYGATVNAIKTLNNLSSNLLQIGQTLKIPQEG